MTGACEVNFDGLVGPTHNYAGLSEGNLAATEHALQVSNPREAALQGLEKMRAVASLGLVQGLLPPHDRPHLATLRKLGFTGGDEDILAGAWRTAPELVRNVCSASAMWTANAATVSPSADSADGRVHFTPANLVAMFHRSIEAPTTGRMLRSIFPEGDFFVHHEPLPGSSHFGDEGAANHNRFCGEYGQPGVQLFVYGRSAFRGGGGRQRFPARQTFEASAAIARNHRLDPGRAVFVRQRPVAIDSGAFHNDVVAVSNRNVLFFHQEAFADAAAVKDALRTAAPEIDFRFIEVPADKVGLDVAVRSYLFNSQLVSPGGAEGMTLILPMEVKETPLTRDYVDGLLDSTEPIDAAHYFDLRQSMRNGGGPACLRLRVVLTAREREAIAASVLPDDMLYKRLEDWVRSHYRDRLAPDDLGDPALMRESFTALDELTGILSIGSIYDFQIP